MNSFTNMLESNHPCTDIRWPVLWSYKGADCTGINTDIIYTKISENIWEAWVTIQSVNSSGTEPRLSWGNHVKSWPTDDLAHCTARPSSSRNKQVMFFHWGVVLTTFAISVLRNNDGKCKYILVFLQPLQHVKSVVVVVIAGLERSHVMHSELPAQDQGCILNKLGSIH